MKKLTAGIFTVLMGLVSVNAADAAVASKGYVDKLDRVQGALVATNTQNITTNTANIATNTENIAKNAEKIGDATFTGANYVSSAEDLTAAVAALDDAVKNVAGGNLQLGKDAVDSNIIKDGEVKTDDIANSAVTEAKIADKAVTANKLSDELSATISGKANSATTLSGYGIADAYTKTEADAKFIDTTEIEGYATDAELTAVSYVANAADTLSKTNKDAITLLNGDENTGGSVAEKIKTVTTAYQAADTETLNSAKGYADAVGSAAKDYAKTYTDQKVAGLNLAEISRVPAACGTPGNYCTLTTNGTNFVWEVIARGDVADEEAPSAEAGSDRLQVTVPAVTEPTVTK